MIGRDELLANVAAEEGPLPTPCWIWQGNIMPHGYGMITVKGRRQYAHRRSYEVFVGPIPDDRPFICHRCHVRSCCNPDHLYAGTAQDNVDDMVEADRHTRGERSSSAILSETEVLEARQLAAEGYSTVEIAEILGRSNSNVSRAVSGTTWKYLPGAVEHTTNKYPGVTFNQAQKQWRVQLWFEGKQKYLGGFHWLWQALVCANYNRAYLGLPIIDYVNNPSPRLLAEGFPDHYPHD